MTWAEFSIRLHAYQRLQKKEWLKVRSVCYQIYISNWQNPKKKPLAIDRYMPLDDKKNTKLTDKQVQAIKFAQERYNKEKNGRTT
jgi:hypothetical protein